jgi:two-component system NtrC family sensor kinase
VKLRIASIAFLLASLCVGLAWLSVQPLLVRLLDAVHRAGGVTEVGAHVGAALPLLLAMDFVIAGLVIFAVLYMTVGRPLVRVEQEIDRLGRLELDMPSAPSGGPLLSRLQSSLRLMAQALREEQATTQRQVNELRATNERLAQTQAGLAASERLATVGKLAAGVAHEIGNPLSGILGYLSIARSRPDGGDVDDYLARIDAEVQRIDKIVRELLELGRPPRLTPGPVDVAEVVRACTGLLGAGPDFTSVQLDVQVPPGVCARAESGALSQVLINLLLNAAHAVDGKGQVTVRGRRDGSEVQLEVQDSGKGLSDEAMKHLFEPFFTTKENGRGTGLGLAISQHLVTQMGGQLQAANAASGGAVFTVRLPSAPD